MNSKNFAVAALAVILVWMLAGCAKTNPNVFSWNYQNQHFIADSSYVITGSGSSTHFIDAFSGLTFMVIYTPSLAIGTYTLHENNNSGQPFMYYNYVMTEYSQSGTLTITSSDSKQISGSFSVTYIDGSQMAGSFTDVPIR